ncbi:neuropeptides B/W receptor type 2-like isoform X2 [Varroa destructor]|nr:neuropeptides B/W receptor type 2-like isoform X2 [Varroa destructor]
MDQAELFFTTSSIVDPYVSHGIISLTILLLAGGLILNLGAILVFLQVPKLLRSTVNTLVRNLFVLHVFTTIVLGTLTIFDWIAWTHDRIEETDQPYVFEYRRAYAVVCPFVHFARATFVGATFGILWIMTLDRALTILFPRDPHTMLLKRHPSLATMSVCVLAPISQSFYLFTSRSGDLLHRDCVYRLNGLEWRLTSFAAYLIPLLLFIALCTILMVRLRSSPAKSSTRTMNRIVLLVILLIASYAICTAPHKVTEVVGAHESLQRISEAMLLLPVVLHPLVYYTISENFRKALSRCFQRRRHLGHRSYCRHAHAGSRHGGEGGDRSAALTITEMTTAFSVTSQDATQEKNLQINKLDPAI